MSDATVVVEYDVDQGLEDAGRLDPHADWND